MNLVIEYLTSTVLVTMIIDMSVLVIYACILIYAWRNQHIHIRSSLIAGAVLVILASLFELLRSLVLRDLISLEWVSMSDVGLIALGFTILISLRRSWLSQEWDGRERRNNA